jgi:hypothetical protein
VAPSASQRKAQGAWDRIEALGGGGVWERDMVCVSLADTEVTDEDLSLFRDFPYVQILDLSRTGVGDAGLAHLTGLRSLTALIVVDTGLSSAALEVFRCDHPSVVVTTEAHHKGAVNPITGQPF